MAVLMLMICHGRMAATLKLYVSGENLLTFTPLRKHARNFDPEVIGAGDPDGWSTTGDVGEGYSYPMMKSYTFGLNIGF